MKYIVLDMEWNRPERRSKLESEPIVLHGEIIQIGAVMLDEDMQEVSTFEMKVLPKFYRKMNKRIVKLTSIDDTELEENGKPFPEVITKFKEWCGDESILLTWGPCDVEILEENLIMHGMDYNWIPEDFDAQIMFDVQETMADRNYSLDYAVCYFRIRGNQAHDALNDARDTAEVIRHLNLQEFITEEREWREECRKEKELA